MTKKVPNTVRIVVNESNFPSKEKFESYKAKTAKAFIKDELYAVHKIPDKIFHFTKKVHVESILSEGLRSGIDGGVFISLSLEDCKNYLTNNIVSAQYLQDLCGKLTLNTEELDDYIIIEATPIETHKSKWYKYTKQNKSSLMFYHGDVQLQDVKLINL